MDAPLLDDKDVIVDNPSHAHNLDQSVLGVVESLLPPPLSRPNGETPQWPLKWDSLQPFNECCIFIWRNLSSCVGKSCSASLNFINRERFRLMEELHDRLWMVYKPTVVCKRNRQIRNVQTNVGVEVWLVRVAKLIYSR